MNPSPSQALTVAVVSEGLDLACTPPCEIREVEVGTSNITVCGKPSVERVKLKFPCCGAVYIRFVCDECLGLLKQGGSGWECDEGCHREVVPQWTVI